MPKYIVLGFVPSHAYSDMNKEYMNEMALTSLPDLKKGNITNFINEFGVAQGIKFILPSVKHQGRFRQFIKNPFAFSVPGKEQIHGVIGQVYRDKGYYPERVNEAYPPESELNGYRKFFIYTDLNQFKINPFPEKYLKQILRLAARNGIKIIYHMQPIPPYLAEKVKNYPYYRQYADFVDSLKIDYPDFHIVSDQDILNKNELYLDVYHLNGKGTPIQSEFLAQKINELELNNN